MYPPIAEECRLLKAFHHNQLKLSLSVCACMSVECVRVCAFMHVSIIISNISFLPLEIESENAICHTPNTKMSF